MKILFYTFPPGHLVSDKEFLRLQKGFAKEGMELIRTFHGDFNQPSKYEIDLIMVKGFSHTWSQVMEANKPVVYYSIGTEWKKGINLKEANEPLRELREKANATVHISKYCQYIDGMVFGFDKVSYVIIPSEEPKLPPAYPLLEPTEKLRLATTCIPRPVKRTEETERLCLKYDIELIPAYGTVSDFSYYYNCHGYIHLSRKEGMPNTMIEALSYGLPCITTNHGGSKEIAQVVINNDPPYSMWDMDNIEPVDDFLFESALNHFRMNLEKYQMEVRSRVLTELNDRVCAQQFKAVFESII